MSVENLVLAINTTLNTFALSSERKEAEAYLNSLKTTDSQEVFNTFQQILISSDTVTFNEPIRQLVLGLLGDWIQNWWNTFDTSQHLFLRNALLQLLLNSPVPYVRPMRIKLAVILSNVTKRQFPQFWESFLGEMTEIWSKSSPEIQEVVMMTIENVITDCIDPDFSTTLPTLRKQDILFGIRKDVGALLNICSQYLNHCMSEYETLKASVASSSSSSSSSGAGGNAQLIGVTNLIRCLLRLLQPLLTYIKSDETLTLQPDLIRVIALFSFPDFESEACNILYVLTSHKLVNVSTFQVILQQLCAFPMNRTQIDDNFDLSDLLSMQSTYAQSIVNLLNYNVNHITSTSFLSAALGNKDLRSNFFQLLCGVCRYPSLRLSYDLLPAWSSIFHDIELSSVPEMKIVCQTVLQEYLNKSVRSVWTKQGATLCAQDEVVEIEFDSHDDYEEVLGYLKSQLRLLLTSFLRRHSSVALMEICGRVEYLILQEGINPENYINRDPTGYIFKDTSFLLRGLESVQPAVDECLKQRQLLIQMHMEDSRRVPAPDPMYAPEDDRRLLSLFDLMMQWNVIDPFLMKWRLRFLLAFCPMLVSDIDRIQQLLSFIFMNLQFNVDTSRLTPLTVPATTPRATIALTKLKDEFLEEAVIVRRRVAAAVPQLFGFCAERIVSSPFYHDLVRQIGSCIADDGGALLGGQKASLRESLVVLSENAQSPGQRDELLSLALEAVVAQWCTLSTQLFINPAVLIDAAKQHCYQSNSSKQNSTTQTLSVDIAPSLMVEASGNPISQVKSILNSVIAIAKRVQCANLEEKLWMEGLQITGDQLSAVFPFTMIWRMMLPGTLAALKVLDDLWNPTIRLSCSAEESVEIYSPPTAFIVSIAMSSLDSDAVAETASLESTTISSVLSDFRRLLYQAIGICCSQRVLYYLPEHTQLIQQLANNISNMENSHVTMLLNQFALKYIFCAPPQVFDVVSGFIENLLSTTQNRVSVAWNKDINSFSPEKPVDMFYQSLYKHCSIPLLGVAVASEVVELAKERIITCMSRAFSDVLASVACIQGPLADKPHTAAGQEPELMATSLLKKKGRKQPVRKPSAFREEDPALEIVIKQNLQVAHRNGMHSLLFGPQSGRLTKIYLQSVLVLLCCPDSGCIRKATSVSDFLLRLSLADVRLRPILGRDLFAALIAIILEEKKAIIGQEWDIVDSIQELYCSYVLGCGSLNNSTGASENLTPNLTATGQGMTQEVTLLEKAQSLWLNRQQGVEEPGCLLTDPRVILLEIPSVTPLRVFQLEHMLLEISSSKKKRRDLFRDFLGEIIETLKKISPCVEAGTPDSIFHQEIRLAAIGGSQSASAVMNIQARVMRPKTFTVPNLAINDPDFTLTSLFDDC